MIENGRPILVIGGGVAGITAAIEAAEAGCGVILLEKSATLGGRAVRNYQYFPKLCPPTCGLEINLKRIKNNPEITPQSHHGITRYCINRVKPVTQFSCSLPAE